MPALAKATVSSRHAHHFRIHSDTCKPHEPQLQQLQRACFACLDVNLSRWVLIKIITAMKTICYRYLLAGSLLLCSLFLFECKRNTDKTKDVAAEAPPVEQPTADSTNTAPQQTVNLDSIANLLHHTGEKTWPKTIPAEVPPLQGGKITGVASSQAPEADSWSVMYQGITIRHLEDYEAALKQAGFKTALFTFDNEGSVSAQKGDLTVACFIDGKGSALTVSRKKPFHR